MNETNDATRQPGLDHLMECVNLACGNWFDPIRYRWMCPRCKTKNSCCEGAPLNDCR